MRTAKEEVFAAFAKFVSNGMHVGLGSDSVASNNVCDILEEARFGTLIARLSINGDDAFRDGLPPAISSVTSNDALVAATLGGARALHLEDQIGALAEGMQADMTIVRLDGAHQNPVHDPVDALIFSSSGRDVLLTMVAGKEIYRDGQVTTVNDEELQHRLTAMKRKLESAHLA